MNNLAVLFEKQFTREKHFFSGITSTRGTRRGNTRAVSGQRHGVSRVVSTPYKQSFGGRSFCERQFGRVDDTVVLRRDVLHADQTRVSTQRLRHQTREVRYEDFLIHLFIGAHLLEMIFSALVVFFFFLLDAIVTLLIRFLKIWF